MKSMTRRNFLTVAGALAGTATLAGCGGQTAEQTRLPTTPPTTPPRTTPPTATSAS